jgi:hypothetical protein
MCLHPDIIDAMIVAGATVQVIAAAARAAWKVDHERNAGSSAGFAVQESRVSPESPRQSQESPCEPIKSGDPKERKRLRDRVNLSNKRAAARIATLSRDKSDSSGDSRDIIGDIAEIRATPRDSADPLSLSPNFKFIKERERESRSESLGRLLALPADWQPNETGWKLALAELGETAAANCLAKFRDHYEAAGGLLRTAHQWQALFRKWVRNERNFTASAQHNLPLMRQVNGGKRPGRDSPSTVWKLDKAIQETLQRARESG